MSASSDKKVAPPSPPPPSSPSTLKAALRRISLFSAMSAADLDRVAGIARTRWYSSGREVVSKEREAVQLFVVLRGRLKVTAPSPMGGEVSFAVLGPGDPFGEIALLDGQVRSASVTTLEPCELVLLDRDAFLALVREHPSLSLSLLQVLAGRVRLLSERIASDAFLGVQGRLGRQILHLVERYGEPVAGGGLRVALRLSQTELGELCGATRESVNKQLRAFRRRGILTHSKDELYVLDLPALRACVQESR